MSETNTRGGFIGDPAAALNPTGGSGCCGSAAPTAVLLPDPATGDLCCGTPAEATAEDACCGSTAKADAVASGQDCCG
jgi:hypothetical protein